MPRRDGTGPWGEGAITGRGLGYYGRGCGFGYGRGSGARTGAIGRGNRCYMRGNVDKKALLIEEKNLLQARLNTVKQDLGDI